MYDRLGSNRRIAGYRRDVTEPGFSEPIIHIDMDAFFVEVERRRDPKLIGAPVAVGGLGPRSVVASASYEARAHGVASAMPMSRARRFCPALVVVPPDHAEYQRVSHEVFDILGRFTPQVERLSIDEAFLDVSGLRLHYPSPVEVANRIRTAIREELDLPSSAGIAPNKFLAKLASGQAKPDGICIVPSDGIQQFLSPLPVRKMWGVGQATYAELERLGVATIGDLAAIPPATLERRVGPTLAHHLHQLAQGLDSRPVVEPGEAKSISVEETYSIDLAGYAALEAEFLRHTERVADRVRRAGLVGRTVTVKIRFGDFSTITRSKTLESATNVGRDIYRTSVQLLQAANISDQPVRLLGVGLSALEPAGAPSQLATDRPAVWDELADAVTEVKDRFGRDAVKPARLTEKPGSDPADP